MRRWQIDPYVQLLADAAHAAVPRWLIRCVVDTARQMGVPAAAELVSDAEEMSRVHAPLVLAELDALLDTDAEAQRTNPLSVLRAAVRHPTEVLARHHVPTPRRTEFDERNFPTDVYALGPATWADVDESLQEPGLIWGAWKAKTVLDRRRGGSLPGDDGGDAGDGGRGAQPAS
ncbi:MAG: hypothetical protein JWN62_2595 [Acidimicrobiales bacterium]|nr:hypothetical protein [Acidimicrobiales bacterium]